MIYYRLVGVINCLWFILKGVIGFINKEKIKKNFRGLNLKLVN